MAIFELSDIERFTLQEATQFDQQAECWAWDRSHRYGYSAPALLPSEFRKEAAKLAARRGEEITEEFFPRLWVAGGPFGRPGRWFLTTLAGETPS